MTKIFATTQPDPVEKSPHDQKPTKTEGEVYTVIKPTILPISIPHAALVKKNRRCHFSWVIGLILLLWILATSAVVFHLAPECVYRKLHALTRVSEPRVSNSERFVFDIAEPDIKMAPKLAQLPPSSIVIDGTANDPLRKQMVIDNEVSGPLKKDVTIDGALDEPPKKEQIVEGTAGQELADNNMVPDEDDATNAVRVYHGYITWTNGDGALLVQFYVSNLQSKIRTLLKRPDVQQVVIVGRNEDSGTGHPPKGVIVIDGSAIGSNDAKTIDIVSQLQNNRGVIVPAEQLIGDSEKPISPMLLAMRPANAFDVTREHSMPMDRPVAPQMPPSVSSDYQQEMAKYQEALMQWQIRREIYRRQLLMRMERERASAAESEMSDMVMEAAPPHRHHMLLMYRMPMHHIMFPPSQQPQPQESAEVPVQEGAPHEDNAVTQRPPQQFAVQMESQRQAMMPQQAVVQQLEQPHQIESPELPMIHPHDASADQIFAAMQADAKVDRDAIFRRLLAQSQMENSRQEQQERAVEGDGQSKSETGDEIFWKMQHIAQNMNQQQELNSEDTISTQRKTHDEIFHELQQQSLERQRETDANEAAESNQPKEGVEQTTVQTSGTEMPLIKVAQSFAHRSTVAEPEQKQERQPTSAAIPFEEVKNDEHVSSPPKSDPLAAFFRFFENEAVNLNREIRPTIQSITAFMPQSTTQATEEMLDLEETSGMELDQPEPAEGTSPFETDTNTPQSAVTQEPPMITSSDEPIVLEVKDEQTLLNSWSRDQTPVIEIPERPIIRVE